MIIPITLADPSDIKLPTGLAHISHDEILLIELQGALDVGNSQLAERNGKFVGKLSIDEGLKRPTLLIGHHLLEGKVASLPKPLAILHRTNPRTKHSEEEQGPPQWTIVGLVKKKIIFSKRPTPVLKRS